MSDAVKMFCIYCRRQTVATHFDNIPVVPIPAEGPRTKERLCCSECRAVYQTQNPGRTEGSYPGNIHGVSQF